MIFMSIWLVYIPLCVEYYQSDKMILSFCASVMIMRHQGAIVPANQIYLRHHYSLLCA